MTFRKRRPGDFEAVSRGFNEAFSAERSRAEWEWKLGVDGKDSFAMVAEDAVDGIIAYYGGPLRRLSFDGREFLAVQPADVYRVKRPRTSGDMVFSQLVLEAMRVSTEEGAIALGYGFPGARHMKIGTGRLSYEDPCDVGYMAKRTSRFDRIPLRRLHSIAYDFDAAGADDLWLRARSRYPAILERTSAFLEHRYVRHPSNHYLFMTCRTKGRVVAWAVIKLGDRMLQWVDLLWDGESVATLVALENAVAGHARKLGIPEMEMWLKGDHAATRILISRGWARQQNPLEVALTTYTLAPGLMLDATAVARDLYVTMGDNDLV